MSSELAWLKSSYSDSGGGNCVEVAAAPHAHTIHVRDSKLGSGPEVHVTAATWAKFISHIAEA
ncbi:DUF397 domain-containing protein [Streptomyces syringium]|uniref:DUF397 domain-containing protein n=1 Tax=Streptomyces syringium TaxID=76729 RepID=UPI0033F1D400